MGRRLNCIVAHVLLGAFGVGLAPAQADDSAPPPDRAAEAPAEIPPPADLPPPPAMADPVPPPAPPKDAAKGKPEGRPTLPFALPGKPFQVPKRSDAGPASAPPAAPAAPSSGPPAPGPVPETGEKPGSEPAGLDPAAALPPPTDMLPAAPPVAAPTRDPAVERTQGQAPRTGRPPQMALAPETNILPPAREAPGRPAPAGGAMDPEKFVLSPESLPQGKQSLGLSIEVKGPPTLNLNKEAIYRIIVTNSGSADATDVTVRDELPPGLEFVSSQPQEQRVTNSLMCWRFSTVAAGAPQVITLKVKPTQVGRFDHGATVTARTGSKSTTRVYEPKLKVVQTLTTEKVLKNRPVEFRVAVTNIGDGPARDVVVLAKLTPGLKSDAGDGAGSDENLFQTDLGDILPGQTVELDPLVADTILGGAQTCKVKAISPDVQAGAPDAENTRTVTVIEPKLKLTLDFPKERFTETIGSYSITIENTGTAAARNVQVIATLPLGGRLVDGQFNGARYDPTSRRLSWPAIQLEPGTKEKVTYPFQIKMGGPGGYQVSAQVRAQGGLGERKVGDTNVIGIADIDLEIVESRRVVDVGDSTTFTVRIKNVGSKKATRLLLSAWHSDNIQVTQTAGTDTEAKYSPDKPGEFRFPQIDELPNGKSIVLGIKVKRVLKPEQAICRVYLLHDDVETKLEDLAEVRITAQRGQ